MAKNIIAIIGARKVGKTYVADMVQSFFGNSSRITPDTQLFFDFLKLNDMTSDDFYNSQDYEENRNLLFLFKEMQLKQDPKKYLYYFINELNSDYTKIVDNVYYFSDLALLIEYKAKIIFLDATLDKRKEFGYTSNMDRQFYAQEVATIQSKDVKNWANTIIVQNTGNMNEMRVQLRTAL